MRLLAVPAGEKVRHSGFAKSVIKAGLRASNRHRRAGQGFPERTNADGSALHQQVVN
jgi:hypothetical protein